MDYLTTKEYSWNNNKYRFGEYNLQFKLLLMNISIILYRTRFLTGWSFSEASLAASGFTYNGINPETKKPIFGRLTSIEFRVEVTHSIQEKVKLWNISV